MITIDPERGIVTRTHDGHEETHAFDTPEAFKIVSDVWLRCGWDTKYVYSFSWFGRPVIQLPEDLIRIQEVIYAVKPDIIIETGVAHGGSLIFYASLCKAMSRGRVIGVDIEIRAHNRAAIEAHELFEYITLIEGSSVDPSTIRRVRELIQPGETVLILLDSNHTKQHVSGELTAYASLVSPGSYIVATDGIMEYVVGAPRTRPEWAWDNPRHAALEFVAANADYVIEEPVFPFNEGVVRDRVTYWPDAFIRRVR